MKNAKSVTSNNILFAVSKKIVFIQKIQFVLIVLMAVGLLIFGISNKIIITFIVIGSLLLASGLYINHLRRIQNG